MLVERIIHKIIDEKIDIDKILVVTFTNAAASEMRERILDAIYKKIEEDPENIHLQKQITLLNKASICTIHSFCLDIIRNYFYQINISGNFQIGDTAEMELLKQEALEELFEEKYIDKDEKFLKLIDTYATYRGDEPLKELILKIENQIQSNPFPKKWLEEKVEMFNLNENINKDFSETIWGKILLDELSEELSESCLKLKQVENNLKKYPELEKYTLTIINDREQLKQIQNKIENGINNIWDETYNETQQLCFDKWPIDKKVTIEYKNEAKQIRDKIKKEVTSNIEKTLIYSSKEANETIYHMYDILKNLKEVIFEFEEKFAEKKKEKNRIDFNDIEHLALKILVKEKDGEILPSDIAKELQNNFCEIAIDEYQDSNLVQEYILNSVSKKNNMFMVGDIKQSIYRFRQARVELFSEKYKNYSKIDEEDIIETNGRKIQLFKNFRSREEVLKFTNWVFKNIMTEKLGNVEYTEEEYLNLGAEYPIISEKEIIIPELHVLDLEKEENKNEEQEETEEKDQINIVEKNEEEAKLVASRIEKLIKDGYTIYDRKKGIRKVKYKDIAILLRSTANIAPIYEKELINKNIPVFCDTSAQYLETTEIQTIICLLKILNNPMQDIPLVTVLRSPIGNFNDNELINIRMHEQNGYFYESLLKSRISVEEELKNKINSFLEKIDNWRKEEKEKPLDELIWQIYQESNYYNYVGLLNNGSLRQANLKMLFERAKQYESASFKGLYNFINFLDRLKTSSGDLSAAKIVGENDNVVRIMSIHKSKGLEFPVVFLSGTGKQFNKQDLNDSILIHQDLGFGPKYIDSNNRIEFPTLAKEAIRLILEKEIISEEMRVLYVALTRAKEKLIITGTVKNLKKSLKDKEEMISIYEKDKKENHNKIENRLLQRYNSYLDWFLVLSLKEKEQKNIKIEIHTLKENQNNEKIIDELIEEDISVNKEKLEKIKKELEWKYPYSIATNIPTKTSVSNLKENKQKELENDNEIIHIETNSDLEIPKFMIEGTKKITSARKGSLIHLCIQKLNEKEQYNKEKLQILVNKLYEKEIILKEEADEINVNILLKYIQSELWNELKNAKEIHKEEPFYLEIQANRLSEEYTSDDKILLQGIIDLYFIDKEDKLILVDYKTDYIEQGQEEKLVQKYKEQLYLYKEALEKALNRSVDNVIIYSTWIGKIEIK